MFSILDFIDSPDIREYNRDTMFTPAEQAVLIARSCKTTMKNKVLALCELVGKYTEKEF